MIKNLQLVLLQTGSLTGGKKAKWKFQVSLCLSLIQGQKIVTVLVRSSLDPTTNFRTHSMGTSTKDDDHAKILPGVEGALLSI